MNHIFSSFKNINNTDYYKIITTNKYLTESQAKSLKRQ